MIEFDRAKVMQPKTVVHCRTEEQWLAITEWAEKELDQCWRGCISHDYIDLNGDQYFNCGSDIGDYTILTYEEALAEPSFERGELVEMRNGCGKWEKRIYLGSIDRSTNPFIAVCVFDEDKFNAGKMFDTVKWQQIRKIPTKTLTWDEVQDILIEKFGTNVDIKIEEK